MFDPASAFEEETVAHEPRQKRNMVAQLLNIWQNTSATIIGVGLLVFLSTLPLIFNFCDVRWYSKIFMLLGSLYALLFLLILPAIFREATKQDKWFLYFSPLSIFYLIGLVAYFNFDLWGYKKFALGIAFAWTLFVGLYAAIKTLFNKAFGEENTPIVLFATALLTLFIAIANEKSANAVNAELCYKISFGVIYLIAISLYTNRYIYKARNEKKVIGNIVGIIFWGTLIIISFPFYIQWCGLNGDSFNAFVSVYAALVGGGITLAGVAWTIKDNDEQRKKEQQKANKQRKEEERIKYFPYLKQISPEEVDKSVECTITHTSGINFNNQDNISKTHNSTYYSMKIDRFYLKNISSWPIIIKGLEIGDKFSKARNYVVLDKNETISFNITRRIHDYTIREYLYLKIKDCVDNEYYVKCKVIVVKNNTKTNHHDGLTEMLKTYQVIDIFKPSITKD